MKKLSSKFLRLPIILLGAFFIVKLIHLAKIITYLPTRDFASHLANIFFMANYGYHSLVPYWFNGYIICLFYPPAYPFIGSILYSLFGHLQLAVFISIILIYIIGFIGCWFLGKALNWSLEKKSFVFLAFYASPFAIFFFNITGRLAEMLGWSIFLLTIPIIYCYKERKIDIKFIIFLAIAMALLILSHPILIIILSVLLLGLFLIKGKKEKIFIILSVIISLLFASFWLIPFIMNYGNSSMDKWTGMGQMIQFPNELLIAIAISLLFFTIFYFYYNGDKKNKKRNLLFYLPIIALAVLYMTSLIRFVPLFNKPFPRTYCLFFLLVSSILLLETNFKEKWLRRAKFAIVCIVIMAIAVSFIKFPTMDMAIYEPENQNIFKIFENVEGKYIIVSNNLTNGFYAYGPLLYNLSTPFGEYIQARSPELYSLQQNFFNAVREENCDKIRESAASLEAEEIIAQYEFCSILEECKFYKKASYGNTCLYSIK